MTVFAFGDRFSNADLVVDLAELGYVVGDVLDVTYGLGRWWLKFRPDGLVGCDIVEEKSPIGFSVDFRCLPFGDGSFDSVVFDPPYKLNGVSQDFANDDSYGVSGGYVSPADRHALIFDGIRECCRVSRRFVIVKCQDQVSSGRVFWQSRIFSDFAEGSCGFRLVDCLFVRGYRPQPAGRSQKHSRRDYSTALVLKRGK
jgi:hypothetical protein